jgi:hypothetical protein
MQSATTVYQAKENATEFPQGVRGEIGAFCVYAKKECVVTKSEGKAWCRYKNGCCCVGERSDVVCVE